MLKALTVDEDRLVLRQVDRETLFGDQVRLKVRATTISPFDLRWDHHGLEVVAEVLEKGAQVEKFAIGDRVVVGGVGLHGWQDELVVSASRCYEVPEAISDEVAVWLGFTFAAARKALVREARLRAGENVLIYPASNPVGMAAVQQGAAMGARVVALVNPEGKKMVKELGADLLVSVDDSTDWPGPVGKVGGIDVALFCGTEITQEDTDNIIPLMRRGGRLVIVCPPGLDQDLTIPLGRMIANQLRLICSLPTALDWADHWELVNHFRHQQFFMPTEVYPLDPAWVTRAARKVRISGTPAVIRPDLRKEPVEEDETWFEVTGRADMLLMMEEERLMALETA